jgi:hypothetical protein
MLLRNSIYVSHRVFGGKTSYWVFSCFNLLVVLIHSVIPFMKFCVGQKVYGRITGSHSLTYNDVRFVKRPLTGGHLRDDKCKCRSQQ